MHVKIFLGMDQSVAIALPNALQLEGNNPAERNRAMTSAANSMKARVRVPIAPRSALSSHSGANCRFTLLT